MTYLPNFDIDENSIVDTVKLAIQKYKTAIDIVVNSEEVPTWENVGRALELAQDDYTKVSGVVFHLSSVRDTEGLRNAIQELLPLMSEFGAYVMQNEELYKKYKMLLDAELTPHQKRSVELTIKDFENSGVGLKDEDKARYKELMTQNSMDSEQFSKNVLDSTNSKWIHITDESDLSGIPDTFRTMYASNAEEKGLDGWVVKLDHPNSGPFMQYADNRELRKQMYIYSATKASEPDYDNSPLMDAMIKASTEQAKMLGYESISERSIDTKMAPSIEAVNSFLTDLVQKSKPKALEEIEIISERALKDGIDPIQMWDYSYYLEKVLIENYQVDDNEIKKYFKFENVLSGLFGLVNELYGLEFRPREVNKWNDDVVYYDAYRNGEHIAGFYLDPYVRSDKRSGAWMNDAVTAMIDRDGNYQKPIAYLVCNFTPPIDGVSLLNHYEIETLFHEFGHGLHHMLTEIKVLDISGISGVEWDAVELPSQLMENWCWKYDTLQSMSEHFETGEKLPRELFDKMLSAKNFGSGYGLMRQCKMSLFDMWIHQNYDETRNVGYYMKLVSDMCDLLPQCEGSKWANSFSHIFAGAYTSGYFSYLWAETLSCDAFTEFEKHGNSVGERFREAILSKGGSKPMMELYDDFVGREPSIEPLLHSRGIVGQ